eukprot:scaffold2799_cov408-Prasinococcus_capsulatus_cf.AAC.34
MAYSQDTEIRTSTIKIESKLFYLDLKENPRGRYLKISEKAAGGRSTVIVPSAGVVWFVDLLNYYASPPTAGEDLTSKELQLDTKVSMPREAAGRVARFLGGSLTCGGLMLAPRPSTLMWATTPGADF